MKLLDRGGSRRWRTYLYWQGSVYMEGFYHPGGDPGGSHGGGDLPPGGVEVTAGDFQVLAGQEGADNLILRAGAAAQINDLSAGNGDGGSI
jgi:hypothetical protein